MRPREQNIAGVEGIAHRWQEVVFGSDVAHVIRSFARIHQREHAIVGRNEVIFSLEAKMGRRARANAWIYHQPNVLSEWESRNTPAK